MKTVRKRVVRWDRDQCSETPDELAAEEPLEMCVGQTVVGVTMRTPGNDLDLLAGFLVTEGLLRSSAVPLIRQEHPNRVVAAFESAIEPAQRTAVMSVSCGICGKASIEAIHRHLAPVDDGATVSRSVIGKLEAQLYDAQNGFRRTGGVHAAGVFTTSGHPVVIREDIGRHNAADKAIGYAVLKRLLPLTGHVLMVSGRVSFEIVQKALAARISIVAAVSAPSALAVDFAEESGQTLIGFLRPGRFNIYAHPHRVTDVASSGSPLLE